MLLVWAVIRSANEGETKSKIDSKDQVFEIKKKEQKKTCKTEKDDWNTCVKLRWESYTLDIALDHLSRTDVSEGMPLFIGRIFSVFHIEIVLFLFRIWMEKTFVLYFWIHYGFPVILYRRWP